MILHLAAPAHNSYSFRSPSAMEANHGSNASPLVGRGCSIKCFKHPFCSTSPLLALLSATCFALSFCFLATRASCAPCCISVTAGTSGASRRFFGALARPWSCFDKLSVTVRCDAFSLFLSLSLFCFLSLSLCLSLSFSVSPPPVSVSHPSLVVC